VRALDTWKLTGAGYYSYLSVNVVCKRTCLKKESTPQREEAVQTAVRSHANFAEYVPFTFGLLFLAELNGAPTSWVHAAYTALFAFRVSHATLGMHIGNGMNLGRKIGFLGTLAVMLGAGLYNVRGWRDGREC